MIERSEQYEEYLCNQLRRGYWKDKYVSNLLHKYFESEEIDFETISSLIAVVNRKMLEKKVLAVELIFTSVLAFLFTVFLLICRLYIFIPVLFCSVYGWLLGVAFLRGIDNPNGYMSKISHNYYSVAIFYLETTIIPFCIQSKEVNKCQQ